MKLRWTTEAASDLEAIFDYLFDKAPDRAAQVASRIHAAADTILAFPYRGRPGKKQGTRELVLAPSPYIVVYRVTFDAVIIVRIFHGSRERL